MLRLVGVGFAMVAKDLSSTFLALVRFLSSLYAPQNKHAPKLSNAASSQGSLESAPQSGHRTYGMAHSGVGDSASATMAFLDVGIAEVS